MEGKCHCRERVLSDPGGMVLASEVRLQEGALTAARWAMTENDWLTGNDIGAMLEQVRGRASQRKLRLLVCAYRRRSWDRLDELTRRAVELAEGYLEGEASRLELTALERDPSPFDWDEDPLRSGRTALQRTADALAAVEASQAATRAASASVGWDGAINWDMAYNYTIQRVLHEEQRIQARLLREVLGNPFRPVLVDPDWLAWDDGAVFKIARSIYAERRFEEMTVLADALEEAGCTSTVILEHCRQAGQHVRGCWLVDRLLRLE